MLELDGEQVVKAYPWYWVSSPRYWKDGRGYDHDNEFLPYLPDRIELYASTFQKIKLMPLTNWKIIGPW